MAEPSKLRVSDEERERVAEEMREHFALGRLDQEELDERVQAAYSARTGAELQAVRADLPQLPATPAQLKAELARRRGELRRRLLQQTGGSLGAFFICAVIWAASGATGFFWPIFVALAVVVPLLRNGWRLYGPAPELDRVEEELVRMESQHRRRHRGHRHRGARRDRW